MLLQNFKFKDFQDFESKGGDLWSQVGDEGLKIDF